MRRALSALVLASIAVLPAMAHASPPDETWLAGIYDDALIALAAWATGATGAPPDVHFTLSPVDGLPPAHEPAPAVGAPCPVRSRAPPAP